MAKVRYYYVDDDTAILFGANGTALTATLAGVSGIISDTAISLPTFPMWCYLIGLVFAFISKSVIMLYNDDVKHREKGQGVRDFLMEARAENLGDCDALALIDSQWADMENQRTKLLTLRMVDTLNLVRAYAFVFSALCFLFGTVSIIIYVGS